MEAPAAAAAADVEAALKQGYITQKQYDKLPLKMLDGIAKYNQAHDRKPGGSVRGRETSKLTPKLSASDEEPELSMCLHVEKRRYTR